MVNIFTQPHCHSVFYGDHPPLTVAMFDISISIVDISTLLKNIDIDMVIFENIDIDIDKAILENIDIKIDIDKTILKISISISIGSL